MGKDKDPDSDGRIPTDDDPSEPPPPPNTQPPNPIVPLQLGRLAPPLLPDSSQVE
ncbi:uncharacterized protein EHS24_009593 [Apiotrichum porosum]|uniref:Uncharacterized protein n=1 Tax=Apiotrichum porosum TaxID=105984 RepID=A0A427XM16_9TREE|nr:uncharacterized protein EHS24_009593 [Apiotrichum porosum]RSH79925.1 hypothetical protein EHS24_009593 [Apiotrichum porosum]